MSSDDHQRDERPSDDARSQRDSAEHNEKNIQQIQQSHVSALVPEKISRGIFSTGVVILQGGHEFILDFLLRMTMPHQVAARVVIPPSVVPSMLQALKTNVGNYEKRFGQIPAPQNVSTAAQQFTVDELYDQLKISDDTLSGTYANAVMIAHTANEFSFDFITTFYPKSVVTCRVYLSAPNVPRLLESLENSYRQYQKRLEELREQRQQEPSSDHDAESSS